MNLKNFLYYDMDKQIGIDIDYIEQSDGSIKILYVDKL